MVSAEPALRLRRGSPRWRRIPRSSSPDPEPRRRIDVAIERAPAFKQEYRAYLDKFGERTVNELKLESATLHDDPLPAPPCHRRARRASSPTRQPQPLRER